MEVLPPERRAPVAGENDVVRALLVVAAVYQVEEEPGVFFVELAVSDFVNDKAGRADETREHGGRFLSAAGCGKLVPKL